MVLDPTQRALDSGGLLSSWSRQRGCHQRAGRTCLSAVARHSAWPAGVEAKLVDT